MAKSIATNDTIGSSALETPFTRRVKFSFLITCQVPSALCSLTIFYYFIRLSELRAKKHNHAIICLLFCNFLVVTVELPITLVYLYFGQLTPAVYSLCIYWVFVNFFPYTTSFWMMAVTSIQRYLFIFHRNLVNSHLKHYTPLALPTISYGIWYTVFIFFYPCQQHVDYTQLWCMGACYAYEDVIGAVDWILSSAIPILTTIAINDLLIIRVVYQKYKIQHIHTWRITRKLVSQLLSISLLFLSIYLPITLFVLIRLWIDPSFLVTENALYFLYAGYLVPLLTPFICLISLPEIVKKIKTACFGNNAINLQQQQIPMLIVRRHHI
ncbi:unnamed protein product [Adineta ricciae]|uniref:G-protein coupled receptors family 1 profile domain-containing protein n=1 Tax=Adineta ricciae TaxID=249248 RepID=A0A815AEB2_ADIRI|nr:unnamed protein product [Adineta ricciae]CAF1414966.1 unnamed protein product [Adineta ricciae]